MARDVIIATFENRNQAYDAARDIDKLDESVIHVEGGAIVEKDMLGNVTWLDSEGLTSPWGAIGGVTAGTLLGALVGTLAGPAGTMTGAQVGAAAAATGGQEALSMFFDARSLDRAHELLDVARPLIARSRRGRSATDPAARSDSSRRPSRCSRDTTRRSSGR
jgi:hypothetical protein